MIWTKKQQNILYEFKTYSMKLCLLWRESKLIWGAGPRNYYISKVFAGGMRPKRIHLYSRQLMDPQFFLSMDTRETRVLKQSRVYILGQSSLLVKLIFVNLFTSLLKCVCYLQINTHVLFPSSFTAMGRTAKHLSPSLHVFSIYCNEMSFFVVYLALFKKTCLCFLLVILQFKMVPKLIAEVLPSILKCKLCYLTGKFLVLGKLPSDISYSAVLLAVGPMLINQQYALSRQSLNRHSYKTRLYVDQLTEI